MRGPGPVVLTELERTFPSGGLSLRAHLAEPSSGRAGANPLAVVVIHGFPTGVTGAQSAADSFPELGDRIAAELGWIVAEYGRQPWAIDGVLPTARPTR